MDLGSVRRAQQEVGDGVPSAGGAAGGGGGGAGWAGGGGVEEEEGPSREGRVVAVVGGGARAWVMGLVPLAVTSTKPQEIFLSAQFGHHH